MLRKKDLSDRQAALLGAGGPDQGTEKRRSGHSPPWDRDRASRSTALPRQGQW